VAFGVGVGFLPRGVGVASGFGAGVAWGTAPSVQSIFPVCILSTPVALFGTGVGVAFCTIGAGVAYDSPWGVADGGVAAGVVPCGKAAVFGVAIGVAFGFGVGVALAAEAMAGVGVGGLWRGVGVGLGHSQFPVLVL